MASTASIPVMYGASIGVAFRSAGCRSANGGRFATSGTDNNANDEDAVRVSAFGGRLFGDRFETGGRAVHKARDLP